MKDDYNKHLIILTVITLTVTKHCRKTGKEKTQSFRVFYICFTVQLKYEMQPRYDVRYRGITFLKNNLILIRRRQRDNAEVDAVKRRKPIGEENLFLAKSFIY